MSPNTSMVIQEYWEQVSDECWPGSNMRKVMHGQYVRKPDGYHIYKNAAGWTDILDFKRGAVTRRGFVAQLDERTFLFELDCFWGIRTFQTVSFEEHV
jgi:hypothetical protein